MNLLEYDYPKVDVADMAFPTFDTIPELLEEAKKRGFYDGNTPYNKLFCDLFYKGGKIVFKKEINKEQQQRVWMYCRSFMGSWAPKHEHKEAICAMLMSEVLEPGLVDKE